LEKIRAQKKRYPNWYYMDRCECGNQKETGYEEGRIYKEIF
jgi:hypothetical protein